MIALRLVAIAFTCLAGGASEGATWGKGDRFIVNLLIERGWRTTVIATDQYGSPLPGARVLVDDAFACQLDANGQLKIKVRYTSSWTHGDCARPPPFLPRHTRAGTKS